MFRFVKFCECFGIWILELYFYLDGGVWKFWILEFEFSFFCEHLFLLLYVFMICFLFV